MADSLISVTLSQQQDYRFDIHFSEQIPVLVGDEPPPLGAGLGPSPVQLLCAAVGNCLSDSLLFALRKYKQAPEPLTCHIQAQVGRNDQGRTRVLSLEARLTLGVPAVQLAHLERVLGSFEDYCTVTQSVGQGIPIRVNVVDSLGQRLK